MTRPVVDESKPLELLPWGQTLETLEEDKKRKRKAWAGCLIPFAALAFVVTYTAGYLSGYLSKPSVNDSPVELPSSKR